MDQYVSANIVTTDTRYGRLAATGDQDIIGRHLIRCGEWAWDETGFVASVLPDNARVLDVGAFLGTFGLGLALRKRLGFLCLVEANPAIVPLLKANIGSNIAVPAVVINAMVTGSPTEPRVGLTDPANLGSTNFAGGAVDGPPGMLPERAMTLAELRAEHGDFDLIKLDVEGMEQEILRGDCEQLARGGTTLWIECNECPQSLELAEMLLSWGLGVHYFAFPSHNPDNFRGEDEPIFPWAYEAGLLVAPRTLPRLDAELDEHRCILRPVGTVEDLREALWRTPRWLPDELAHAETPELAAAVGRALRGQDRSHFLLAGMEAPPPQLVWERLRTTEAGLARAEALAFERLEQVQQERDRREAADQRLAGMTACALARLAEIGVERERADWAAAQIVAAESRAEAVAAQAEAAVVEAKTHARVAERRLAEIEMTILWRMALPFCGFVTARPRLHGALRRARRVGGTILGRR